MAAFVFPFEIVSSIFLINCCFVAYILQLSEKTFFCRVAEETFSWRIYLNFAAKVLMTWRVSMDFIKWLSGKKTSLPIKARSRMTLLLYAWDGSTIRRSSHWLNTFFSMAKQWLHNLFFENSLDYVGSCGGIHCPCAVGTGKNKPETLQLDGQWNHNFNGDMKLLWYEIYGYKGVISIHIYG